MANSTEDLVQALVTRAILDKAFRDALISAVAKGGPRLEIALSELEIAELKQVLPDLERFANLQGLQPEDAKSWAIGIFEIKDLRSRGRRHPRP
jgi:hypothetical protein